MSAEQFKHASQFPPDMSEVKTGINQLNNQQLVHYFEQEWSKYTP
jgi:spermidine synthase